MRYQSLASVYRSSDMMAVLRDGSNLKGKCSRCEYNSRCGGSRARAQAMTGDLFAAEPLCSYQPGASAAAAPTAIRGGTA